MSHILPIFRRFRTQLSSGPVDMVVDSYRRYGTSAGTAVSVELGDTPVHNWTGMGYRDFPIKLSEDLSDQAVVQPLIRSFACQSCPVACGGIVTLPDGDLGHKPEYETLGIFRSDDHGQRPSHNYANAAISATWQDWIPSQPGVSSRSRSNAPRKVGCPPDWMMNCR